MVSSGTEDTGIERLPVLQEGFNYLDSMPLPVYLSTQDFEDALINSRRPAYYKITPNLGCAGISLSIWLWDGIPNEFREILLYHELVEAKLILRGDVDDYEAHNAALEKHCAYARKFLTAEKFEKFIAWQNRIYD